MPIWQQFWFTGQNNILNPLSQTIPQTWFNNTSYANSRYPWLDEDELKKLEQAAKDAGYTWNNLQKGMDIIYQNWINKFNNNKKLEERDWLINKQCFETAQYSGKDKNLREQQDRVTVLAQSIKRAYPKIKADYDDCEVINAYVTWKWFQEEYDNYIRNWDKTILEELQWKSRGSYTEPDKNFWATNAGMFTAIGWWAWLWYLWLKWVIKWAKALWDVAKEKLGARVDLETIGKKMYSDVLKPTESDKLKTQRAEWSKILLEKRQKQLADAEKELAEATKLWDETAIKAAQAKIDDINAKIKKLEPSIQRWETTLADTAIKYQLEWWNIEDLWIQADAASQELWQDWIEEIYRNSKAKINFNESINNVCDDIIANPDKYATLAEDKNALVKAAEKIKADYANENLSELQALDANEFKSAMAWKNKKLYDVAKKWQKLSAEDEAEILVRENILKDMRWKLYEAWDEVLATYWEDAGKFRQMLKDYWDLEEIKDLWVKWKSPEWFINKIKGWAEWKIRTKVGKELAKRGKEAKTAETVAEATPWVTEWVKEAWKVARAVEWTKDMAKESKWILKKLWTKWKWLLKWIVKWWHLFTILEDWTLIPWSPTNLASEALETTIQAYKDESSVYKWKTNGIDMIWDKEKVDKAIEKRGKGDGTFLDRYWNLFKLNDDWTISEIL